MNCLRVPGAACVLLVSAGCLFQKKPVVQTPVAMPPAQVPSAAVPPPTAAPAPTPPATQPTATAPTAPAAAEPAKPSPFPPVPGATPKPKPVAPTPVPALVTILTADQRKQLDTAYQSDLDQANGILAKLSGRTLTAAQNDSVTRARAFIRQAAQFHDRDLTTAAELARRARVLTQDLAAALK